MHSKQELYRYCCSILEDRIEQANQAMDSVQDDSNSETKSSAGDKYETARAMAQLEKEQHAQRKAMIEDMLIRLRQIGCTPSEPWADEGSLVQTNRGMYFIAVGLGTIVLDGQAYHCLSLQSPFGQALFELEVGDDVAFRETDHEIVQII